jgi:hypothetical protein
MTENHNPKYNFKEHIINLSHSDNFDDALKEWIQMPDIYKKLHKGSCKCICQRKIKNFYYIYNKKTFKNINVGTGCYNKFNFTITNSEIPMLLQDMLQRYAIGESEYENIEDLEEYSTNIKLRIEQELTDMYKRWDTDIIKLYKLKDDIIELIEDYNFTCLEDLKKLVIETIIVLEKEKVEKEKIKQKLEEERIKKENIENEERIKKENIVREERIKKENIERKEQIKLKINEKQIIDKNITLYNNNIEKWKLMTDKKEINENDDDYNKRIIYTKNGPLKIKDIILLSGIKIDKDIEVKIRQIGYIEDGNDCYMDLDKPWFVNYIDYKEFIKCYINNICYLNIKFNILSKKIYNI